MATSLVIEEERGTFSGFAHPHNGYYAGDFSGRTTAGTSVEATLTVLPLRPTTVSRPVGYPSAA
jgi:hypothetical protein